jgi:alpha-tubulin suppressor-like RCC1 family protein
LFDNGVTGNSLYAKQVTTNGTDPLTNVISVTLGWQGACALVDAGSTNEVWCWGANTEGEAGTGMVGRVQYPTKMIGLTNPTQIRMMALAAVALDEGKVRCWGRNQYRECGTTQVTPRVLAPTYVKYQNGDPLDGVTDLGSTGAGICAIRTNQSLWCWGNQITREYATSYPVDGTPLTGVTMVGYAEPPVFLTSDGEYHVGATTRTPNCGSLE